MNLSFTGVVYFPTSLAVLFIAYRFYLSWIQTGKHDSYIFFLAFFSLALVSFSGVFAGTVFSHNNFGIAIMLIISSFLLSFANALFAYLFIFYGSKKLSPYVGFGIVFYPSNLLIQPDMGTTCCAHVRLGAYFSF